MSPFAFQVSQPRAALLSRQIPSRLGLNAPVNVRYTCKSTEKTRMKNSNSPYESSTSILTSLFKSKPSQGGNDRSLGKGRREGRGVRQVRSYFKFWNQRRMSEAVDLFTEDCSYEDTLYPGAFRGKEALKAHLFRVADALPDSFAFVLDEVSDGDDVVGVQWHVESEGKQLPFTRGSSIYKLDRVSGKLCSGFDVPEPTVKSGSASLAVLSLIGRLLDEPRKAIPLAAFIFYCWFVFLSTVAPGSNALSLDPATWAEVRDLSLNFWLVMPSLAPQSSPVLHPCLEGLFNLLLAWAALFSGFMVDGKVAGESTQARKTGEGRGGAKNAFLPYVLGMQLLTNAVYLPYLVLRKNVWKPADEPAGEGYTLTKAEALGESKIPPLVFIGVGLLSLAWAGLARGEVYGVELSERWRSFVQILTTDRLTFSFAVDLLYFWIFQGWLLDDDIERRGGEVGKISLSLFKAIPFLGLGAYLMTRPPLLLGGERGSVKEEV